jgi:hypothetical protein
MRANKKQLSQQFWKGAGAIVQCDAAFIVAKNLVFLDWINESV